MADQDKLNADVAELVAATTAISAEIDSLKTANPAVDFTGLDAAVASLQGLVPPPAPAPGA
jgi:predicted negative regulator of RcsB-dependent stress response